MNKWIWILVPAVFSGCEKTPADYEPVDYEYVFEMPDFMEKKPVGTDLGQFRWIWYPKDRLSTVSHVLDKEPREVLESAAALKNALEEKLGLTLKSEFTEVAPGQFRYEEKGEKGWKFMVAEETPDHWCTVAIFAIYSSVTRDLRDTAKAEAIVESLKAGRFVERTPSD